MKRYGTAFLSFLVLSLLVVGSVWAHFGMIIPSEQIVVPGQRANVDLKILFAHPFEKQGLNLDKPSVFGVLTQGKKYNLLSTLKPVTIMGCKAWETTYDIKRPGVYIFYMEPKPYWEPAEDCYIVHYTKVVLSAFGLEDGWDEEVGLKTEIVPLSKPYGQYAGNVFQGVVKVNGKPVPYAEVEVEYYNDSNGVKYTAPNDSMITQVIKTDGNGVFTYAAPKPGWWGFAALNTDDKKIKGKNVEIGAVIWVKFYEMK